MEAVENHRAKILADARAKMAEMLRAERGIEAPVPQPAEQPVSRNESVPKSQPGESSVPQVDPAQLERLYIERIAQAEAAKAEAARLNAEAEAKLAQLRKAAENPVRFLEETGLSLDQWNARLLNGGEPTPEERLKAEVQSELQKRDAELAALRQQLVAREQMELRSQAKAELEPQLAKEFPMIAKRFGADQALDWLQREAALARQHGVPFKAQEALKAWENDLRSVARVALEIPEVRATFNNSVSKPTADIVDNGPRTITNRITSSTAPSRPGPTSMEEKRARARELVAALTRNTR